MCQEHQCRCCPDDLPVESCDCYECFHDNKPNKGDMLPDQARMSGIAGLPEDETESKSCPKSCCKPVEEAGVGCQSKQPTKCDEVSNDETEGEVCNEVGPCKGNDSCGTPQQVSTCCSGGSCEAQPEVDLNPDGKDCCTTKPSACKQEPDVPVIKEDACSASKPKALPCGSGDTCQPKEKIAVSEGGSCCSAKPDSCSQNVGEIKTDLPAQKKSNCCASDAKSSSCCSKDQCSSNKKISTPEADDCCSAKSCGTNSCSQNVGEIKTDLPAQKKSDCCAPDAKTSSCCSRDQCSSNKKTSTPDVDDGCTAKPGCCSQSACGTKAELTVPQEKTPSRSKAHSEKPDAIQSSCEDEDCCQSENEPLIPSNTHSQKPVAINISCEDETCCQGDSEPGLSEENEPLLSSAPSKKPVAIEIHEEVVSAVDDEQPGSPGSPSGASATTKLRVQNICCAMEGKLVEDTLKPLDGVSSVSVNVIGRVVYVRHVPNVTSAVDLVTCLNGVHLGASIMESGSRNENAQETGLPRSLKLFGVYLLIQAVLMVIAVTGFFMKSSWYKWVAIAEIIFGIVPILRKSFVSVKTCTLDINILMLIAIAGTIAIQEWVEGATVVFVYSVAEGLEDFCMHKVQRTIAGLMLKAPQMAVLAGSGECVHVEEVAIGTVIAVRPGELIPLDGVVTKGRAAVDESSISGEAVPVEKSVDSKVYSGTVNQNGYLEVKTTVDSSSSTVSKVADMVEEAQASSTQTEVVINRFAKYYTPVVVVLAVLLVAVPAVLGAGGVGTYLEDISEWGKRALFLLVIACPCALVMATPIAIVCGITASARNGALVKGAVHLETLARLQILAFDKTGTLTEGKFQVTDIECAPGVDERETLRLAAAIESKTSHPLAAGIVNKFSGCVGEMVKSQSESLPPVSNFQLHEGRGISGVVNGKRVQIGNREFLHHVGGILLADMEEKYTSWSQESKTVVFVCVNGTLAMMMSLADSIRPNSLTALKSLREIGVQTAMITGDNSQTAMAVKNKLGLDQCVSEMKPHEKLSWIKDKQEMELETPNEIREHPRRWPAGLRCRPCSRGRAQGIVGMVGDGVNDGPALAASNVGIAMGAGGTALAVEAADVALMSNNLSKIPELVLLGRFCRSVVRQNIAVSVLLKLLIVAVALAGKAALWMAVLADVLGLLCVILNGLRPLWWKAKAKKIQKKKRGCFGRKGSSSFTRITVV